MAEPEGASPRQSSGTWLASPNAYRWSCAHLRKQNDERIMGVERKTMRMEWEKTDKQEKKKEESLSGRRCTSLIL